MAAEKQGINYKLISMPLSYLDDYEYDFKVVPASLQKQDKEAKRESLMGEIQALVQLWPNFFASNSEKYLSELLGVEGKHIDEFAPPAPPTPPEDDIAESMSYKDAPPSIRRQMEKKAGFEPATESEVSPNAPDTTAPGNTQLSDLISQLN